MVSITCSSLGKLTDGTSFSKEIINFITWFMISSILIDLVSIFSNVSECSLRSATGFKLSKGIVKKFYAVPNIYECELLCFKEREFPCASYAFR